MSTPTTRYAGTNNMEAASPPLTHSWMGRAGYGAAPPISRVLRIATRRPQAALDLGDLGDPVGSQTRAGTGPAPTDARPIQDLKNNKITIPEVSTVSGDCPHTINHIR
jgi:hypothetical protein